MVPAGRKFMQKSKTCYLVGFTNTRYKVYDPKTKKVETACNVIIHENCLYKNDFPIKENITNELKLFSNINQTLTPCTCPHLDSVSSKVDPKPSVSNVSSNGGGENSVPSTLVPSNLNDSSVSDAQAEIPEIIVEQEIEYDWDSIEVNKLPIRYDRFGDYDPNVFTAHQNQSLTYHEAITGLDSVKWLETINKELEAMKRYDVWEIVPKRKDVQTIPIKWIFSLKSNGMYKARLVVVGCRDKNKAARVETTSPTPTSGSIKWLFILASKFGWNMWQLDLTNAFLNGKIDREKYVRVPQGINYDSTKYMCRLKKALYGLDIAAECFHKEIDSFLKSQDFEQNKREPCI